MMAAPSRVLRDWNGCDSSGLAQKVENLIRIQSESLIELAGNMIASVIGDFDIHHAVTIEVHASVDFLLNQRCTRKMLIIILTSSKNALYYFRR